MRFVYLKGLSAFAAGVLCFSVQAQIQGVPFVTVEKAALCKESVAKTYVGSIVPREDVALVPRVTGFINKIHFKDGAMVKKGQLLFEFEDTAYVAKVKSCQAQLTQAKVQEDFAAKEYIRSKRLREKDAVAVTSFDNAVRAYYSAKASTLAAEAALMDAKNNLSYTKIYSPISGRIGKCILSPGNLVTPSTGALCSVVSLSPIRVRFALSERIFTKEFGGLHSFRKNALVRIILADGTLHPEVGEVEIVDSRFNASSNTILVWVRFPNRKLRMIPGGYATVKLARKNTGKICAVSPECIVTRGDGVFVYVVDKDNTARLRKVVLGNSSAAHQEILSGLRSGETVVRLGTHKVRDGGKIRVK